MTHESASCGVLHGFFLPILGKGREYFLPVKVLRLTGLILSCFSYLFPFSDYCILLSDTFLGFTWELQLLLALTGSRFSTHLTHSSTTCNNKHFSHIDISVAVTYHIPSHFGTFVHILLPSVFSCFLCIFLSVKPCWVSLVQIGLTLSSLFVSHSWTLLNLSVSSFLKLRYNSCVFLEYFYSFFLNTWIFDLLGIDPDVQSKE